MRRQPSPHTVGTALTLLTGAPALWWYMQKKEQVMTENVKLPESVKFIKNYACLEAMRTGYSKLDLRVLAKMVWR